MAMSTPSPARMVNIAHPAPPAEVPRFLGQDTPARVFRVRAAEWADRPALRHKRRGLRQSLTWGADYAHAPAVAEGRG